jgi:anti-sigma factor ChrR (cupin superfamily)
MKFTRLVIDLLAASDLGAPGWQTFWPGIERRVLYEQEGSGSAALLRYQPGAKTPPHRHAGLEHIYVLRGSQRDERGRYEAGTLVVNEPGSSHQVTSDDGCVVLVVWQKPIELLGA